MASENNAYGAVLSHYTDLDRNPNNLAHRRELATKYLTTNVENPSVLDLGCGTGWYSTLFENYTGIDICPEMIDYARNNYSNSGKKKFLCGNALELVNQFYAPQKPPKVENYVLDFLGAPRKFWDRTSRGPIDLVIMQAFIHLFELEEAKRFLIKIQQLCPEKIYFSTTISTEAKSEYAKKGDTDFYRHRMFYTEDLIKELIESINHDANYQWTIHRETDPVQNKEFFVVIGENPFVRDYHKNGFVVLKEKIPDHIHQCIDKESMNLRNNVPKNHDWIRFGRSTHPQDISRVERFLHLMPELKVYLFSDEMMCLLSILLRGDPIPFKEKINFKLSWDPPFPPHQDVTAGWPNTRYITIGIAIDDTYQENGCLWFLPGKHHETLPNERSAINPSVLKDAQWVCLELKAGSVILFDGLAPHRSFPNLSGRDRRMIFVTFGADLPQNINIETFNQKIDRQPPIDDWNHLGIKSCVRDGFGKFITYPEKYTKEDLAQTDFIILMGRKNVGKDTFGNYLAQKIGWSTYVMAKPVKEICKTAFHLTDEQVNDSKLKEMPLPRWNKTPRQIMQFVYINLFTKGLTGLVSEEEAELFFVKHMEDNLAIKKIAKVIITDLRSPEYAQYLQQKYRTIIIQITRPGELIDTHSSEMNVPNFYLWDWLIENHTTIEDFHRKIDLLFDQCY